MYIKAFGPKRNNSRIKDKFAISKASCEVYRQAIATGRSGRQHVRCQKRKPISRPSLPLPTKSCVWQPEPATQRRHVPVPDRVSLHGGSAPTPTSPTLSRSVDSTRFYSLRVSHSHYLYLYCVGDGCLARGAAWGSRRNGVLRRRRARLPVVARFATRLTPLTWSEAAFGVQSQQPARLSVMSHLAAVRACYLEGRHRGEGLGVRGSGLGVGRLGVGVRGLGVGVRGRG
jgi:hypothetical protein